MVNVIGQASAIARKKWNSVGRGWKIALAVLIGIVAVIGLVALILWVVGKCLKFLSPTKTGNLNLYFPASHRR